MPSPEIESVPSLSGLRRCHVLFALLFLAAAPAQAVMQLSGGSVSASAGTRSHTVAFPNQLTTSANDSGGVPPFLCSADASAAASAGGSSASVTTRANSMGACDSFGFGMAANASGNCRARVSASSPVAGALTLQPTTNPFAGADVGADGIREDWSNPVSVVVASPGFELTVSAFAAAQFPLTPGASSSAAVSFSSATAELTTTGQPCEASLSAWSSTFRSSGTKTLSLRGWTGVSGAFGYFVLGVTPTNLTIPPLNCVLTTDILVPIFAPINAQGVARLDLSLSPIPIGTFFFQFIAGRIEANGEVWRTSNRVAFQSR